MSSGERDFVFPKKLGNILISERDEVKSGASRLSWEEYDKSFDAYTDGLKAAGYLVFGYIDGEGSLHNANSEVSIYDVFDKTKNVSVVFYNPKPRYLRVKGEDLLIVDRGSFSS